MAATTIALDAMGGDHGPEVVVPGAEIALASHPELKAILYGDEARIAPLIAGKPALADRLEIVHTDNWVAMDAKPSQALKSGRRNSSMWLALQAVREGRAQAAVSAGNTGALMAMAKIGVKTLGPIQRPAIAAIWPTVKGECIVLDLGANVGADALELEQYALMGAAMARALWHDKDRPTVALLNIGVEEVKGVEEIKSAHAVLKEASHLPIEYKGFIEGDKIGFGVVDVVVTDGFTGNVALKTAEGTARQIGEYLKAEMTRTTITKAGGLLARNAFRRLKEKMDPRRVNGGVFLGLQGVVIKSHGGTDAVGFARAIEIGYEMVDAGLVARIAADVEALGAEGQGQGGKSHPAGGAGGNGRASPTNTE